MSAVVVIRSLFLTHLEDGWGGGGVGALLPEERTGGPSACPSALLDATASRTAAAAKEKDAQQEQREGNDHQHTRNARKDEFNNLCCAEAVVVVKISAYRRGKTRVDLRGFAVAVAVAARRIAPTLQCYNV